MKKIINYEKDILFKTNIGEICSVCLEHDFTVESGALRGEFILSGEYKANELSINKEAFTYRLPLEYELEDTCDIDTLTYDIDNFEYTVKDDVLSVYIDFGIRYDEKVIEPIIPTISEEEINSENLDEEEMQELSRVSKYMSEYTPIEELNNALDSSQESDSIDDDVASEGEIEEMKEERLDPIDEGIIIDSVAEDDEYMVYHVHIVREGETLETIASMYNSTVEVIKEYNHIETLEIKSKVIIPEATL